MELFKIFASKSYYVDFKEIRENFIDKAFNKIQAIKVLFHSDDIKYELGANNIKTLQNKGGIYKVYAANIQGQEVSDYNEIYNQRQDYKTYLESQRNLVEKNNLRREKQKQIRKEQGIDNDVLLTLDDAYDVLFNTYTDLQSFTMRYISDNKVHKLISNYQIDITNNYDFYKLQEINPVNMRTYNYGTRRYKDIRYYYYINNIGDAFIVLNYYLELLLTKVGDLSNRLTDLLNNKNKSNPEEVLRQISSIKSYYNTFFSLLNYKSIELIREAVNALSVININVENILNNLNNIKKRI